VLPWLALAPFAAAFVAPWLVGRIGAAAGWVLAAVPAILFVAFLGLVPRVAAGEAIAVAVDWVPTWGIRYGQLFDGLSVTFALLVTGIGALIVVYAGGYLKGDPHQGRFLAFLLLFMGAMLGLVIADDLVTLFIFYELTSITSFLLIGYDHGRPEARRAALQALLVTGGGGLCLLAAIVLIRLATGESSVSGLFATPDALRGSALYTAIFVLMCLGAFTKSAQVPFHSWLPNAMEAPTPVSAYLHSATMVKAGVFVLMRFAPVMGETDLWTTVLPVFGGATLLVGTILGAMQTDLKQILAYTTVASLGLLVMLTGLGSDYAIAGAVLYLLAHALFKGGLFMVAGAIDHETGTRDITVLGGVAGKMPVTFAAALLCALSMAGLPPLGGFVAKEVLYDGAYGAGWLAALVAIAGNAIMFALAVAVLFPFFRKPRDLPKMPHEAPPSLWLGPVVLASLTLVGAVFLHATLHLVALPMVAAIGGDPALLDIHLFPTGLKPPVVMTLVTVGIGIVLAAGLGTLRRGVTRVVAAIGWGPDKGFDQALGGVVRGAFAFTRLVQPGSMRLYMKATFIAIAVALFLPFLASGLPEARAPSALAEPYHFMVLAVAVIGLLIVILAKTRLVAIVSLGVQGIMVALIFMLYGAPDLSFTQFMVETLSVVILALVMTRLDLQSSDHRPAGEAVRDGAIAVLCGLGFGLLLYGVVVTPFNARLSDFFMEYAYVAAHGRNVVNVILVDFRALDTLGEIAVVTGAGLAILVLLKMGAPGGTVPPAVRLPGTTGVGPEELPRPEPRAAALETHG
jgi:multicomponent Na+:H+ antiporter subunit A